eukprot:3932945-Rhodomonas_salina.2
MPDVTGVTLRERDSDGFVIWSSGYEPFDDEDTASWFDSLSISASESSEWDDENDDTVMVGLDFMGQSSDVTFSETNNPLMAFFLFDVVIKEQDAFELVSVQFGSLALVTIDTDTGVYFSEDGSPGQQVIYMAGGDERGQFMRLSEFLSVRTPDQPLNPLFAWVQAVRKADGMLVAGCLTDPEWFSKKFDLADGHPGLVVRDKILAADRVQFLFRTYEEWAEAGVLMVGLPSDVEDSVYMVMSQMQAD